MRVKSTAIVPMRSSLLQVPKQAVERSSHAGQCKQQGKQRRRAQVAVNVVAGDDTGDHGSGKLETERRKSGGPADRILLLVPLN
jgi:hypothetical protein